MGRISIVVARMFLGVCFLVFGGDKVFGGEFMAKGSLAAWSQTQLAGGKVFAFYRPFLENIVIPNDRLFAIAVAFGEFALGIALVAGVMLRPAGALGILLVASICFSSAAPPPNAEFSMILGSVLQFATLALLMFIFAANADDKKPGSGSRSKKKEKD
ncbi:MAG: DoxX family membrane protein [bacterium]